MNMEIQYYGANGIRIITKKSNIVIDPVSDITNISIDTKKATAVLATNVQSVPPKTDGLFIVDCPGEYEFEDYSLQGIAAQPHTAASGDESATMYRITTNGISVLVTGHINEKLSELQLEAIGVVDVVIVPVGGGGYTLDATGAATIIRNVEPKLVIPVHSGDDTLSYSVPQQSVELFEKEIGADVAADSPDKLKIKTLPDQLTVQKIKQH